MSRSRLAEAVGEPRLVHGEDLGGVGPGIRGQAVVLPFRDGDIEGVGQRLGLIILSVGRPIRRQVPSGRGQLRPSLEIQITLLIVIF